MPTPVPSVVAEVLRGHPAVGSTEQAFPFLTVDPAGFPHVCLLSRAELDVVDDEIRAVIASTRSAANLERSGLATLLAISGSTSHYLKLRMQRHRSAGGVLTAAFAVADHIVDSLGIPLTPITCLVPENLDVLEARQRSRRRDEVG